jgi:hypothetical protein
LAILSLNPNMKNGKSKLIEAVRQLGNNWDRAGALVPGRTNAQCSVGWRHHLDATIDQKAAYFSKWTLEEDAKLTEGVTELSNSDRVQVAALVPARTNNQCRVE